MIFSNLLNFLHSRERHSYSAIKLLSTLNVQELKNLNSVLHHRTYVRGEIIFDKGEDGQAIYFVLDGTVTLQRPLPDGDYMLTNMEAGDSFGILALLLDEAREAQALARSNCQLAVLFRSDLQRLLETQATIASKINLEMARQLARILHDLALHESQPLNL
ncbi:Cyclic nucleotide-binding domain-containing protein [Collimonas sp. OK307]|nr:Cyclic nucleotide-binding domain-containing protein [Collimonas sp. OK307]